MGEGFADVGEHGFEGGAELLVDLHIEGRFINLIYSSPFNRRADFETQVLLDLLGKGEVGVGLNGAARTGLRYIVTSFIALESTPS